MGGQHEVEIIEVLHSPGSLYAFGDFFHHEGNIILLIEPFSVC